MTPNEYLDAAKEKIGVTSDYALAQRFDVSRQRICEIRKGNLPMDNATAFLVAITLGWSFSGLSETEAVTLGGAAVSAAALFCLLRGSHNLRLCR